MAFYWMNPQKNIIRSHKPDPNGIQMLMSNAHTPGLQGERRDGVGSTRKKRRNPPPPLCVAQLHSLPIKGLRDANIAVEWVLDLG